MQDQPPTVFVLFGATGDLAKRMVLPAFFTLAAKGLLPKEYLLVGNGRGDVSHEDFKGHVHDVLTEFGPHPDEGPWDDFSSRLRFAGGGFDSEDPGSLLDVLAEAEKEIGHQLTVHYFAVPPTTFVENTKALGAHDLTGNARVVYEKPFGTSPQSFAELNDVVHEVLDEDVVYRIDHFLGKEATQNLHVLRFANTLIGDAWNAEHVSSVQIDVPETLDITDRAKFYDSTGALLDMVVTHLLQVAAEVAMEPPASMSAADLQSAREEVISHFRPIDPAEVVLGQFDGYRDVDGVADDSTMDTFAACRLWVDTDRWRGVPFLLRTGKMLAEGHQQVSLILKQPDTTEFQVPDEQGAMIFDLSGTGAVKVSLVVKRPGPGLELATGDADLVLAELPDSDALQPYVRLIHDVLAGERGLFTRSDGLAATWKVLGPLLADRPEVQPYAPGSWGPAAAADLAAPHRWLLGQ
ncbi:glucose-6-phosphate dehydrogenase [Nakamurella flavida]|uniref:glucose-6-phosphate dehydrogenase n=1 Tax=Nakamurella flavida TaxID=363630 RepID=UPI00351FE164